jgi:Co/Zn/Cd efflux system component
VSHVHKPVGHFEKCPIRQGLDICWCEKESYKGMLLVGLIVFVLEMAVGFFYNILSVIADGGHLGTDILSDGVAVYVAAMALTANDPFRETKIRAIGGLVQASLLALMGFMILQEAASRVELPYFLEQFVLDDILSGENELHVIHPWAMILIGYVAAIGNAKRHELLERGREHSDSHKHVNYWVQLFHVVTDWGYSLTVALGGTWILITKNYALDAYISLGIVGIAWFLASIAVVLSTLEFLKKK